MQPARSPAGAYIRSPGGARLIDQAVPFPEGCWIGPCAAYNESTFLTLMTCASPGAPFSPVDDALVVRWRKVLNPTPAPGTWEIHVEMGTIFVRIQSAGGTCWVFTTTPSNNPLDWEDTLGAPHTDLIGLSFPVPQETNPLWPLCAGETWPTQAEHDSSGFWWSTIPDEQIITGIPFAEEPAVLIRYQASTQAGNKFVDLQRAPPTVTLP